VDTSIYTGPILQLVPHTVNVWVDAPSSQKIMEGISSQVSSLSMWSTFNLLEHISLKKWLFSVSASHIPFGNKSWKANEMSVCINTGQSWLFIPYNLHSSIITSLDMFEVCPSRKCRLLSVLETPFFIQNHPSFGNSFWRDFGYKRATTLWGEREAEKRKMRGRKKGNA